MNNPYDQTQRITFGICADVHQDIMHDASDRLGAFVDAANAAAVDFSVQLGDFCVPKEENRPFSDIWNTLEAPGYHALGNHDMDGGYTREQTVAYLSMAGRYYSFDMNGWHFVVLDGNDPQTPIDQNAPHPASNPLAPPRQGYPSSIADDQLAWLRNDLQTTDYPVIMFMHQSLELSIINRQDVRTLLEDVNARAGWPKVLACFNGHHHLDYEMNINGIWHIQINSMSCYWMGTKYACVRYSDQIDQQFPAIKCTAPYQDPLYAMVTLETDGTIHINGVQSDWVGPSPQALGVCSEHITPCITSRILRKDSSKRD